MDVAAAGPLAVLLAACTVGILLPLPALAGCAVRGSIRGAAVVLTVAAALVICAIVLASILGAQLH